MKKGLAVEASLGVGGGVVRFGGHDGDDVVGDVGGGRTRVEEVGGEEFVVKACHGL